MDQEKSIEGEKQTLVEEKVKKEPELGSWFSSFVNSAKQKSTHTLEFMKRDLTEFKDTVQQNTSAALSSTANFIGETINSLNVQGKKEEHLEKEMELLKKNEAGKNDQQSESLSSEVQRDTKVSKDQKDMIINFISSKAKSLLSSLVDVMAMTEYEDDEDDICIMRGDKMLTIERGRWDMLVKAIQSDPQTYCHEPEGPPEDYENWLASFNLIDYDLKIHNLLEKSNDVKSFYDQLVPSSLTPDEFWHRYFYKLFQLRQLEFRRLALKADSESRAEKQETVKNSDSVASDLSEKLEKALSLNSAESEKELPILINEDEKDIKQMLKVNNLENELSKNKVIESVGSSSPSSDHTKQSEGSEDWEKAELGDIVDEAAKKLACKLNENPEKNENSDIGDWEWE